MGLVVRKLAAACVWEAGVSLVVRKLAAVRGWCGWGGLDSVSDYGPGRSGGRRVVKSREVKR
jgi:hypothetical protein